jgi:phosphoglycerol transferase MdoB-like AlkP superfamily enzyme
LAIHGFLGTMFSRNRWYPSLAFDDVWFAPELDERIVKATRCGIAFHGICDSEVWNLIGDIASGNSGSKQFIYWLTLTAHLPMENPDKSSSESCESFDMLVQHPELCNLVLQQRKLFSNIATHISSRKLTNTRILLVGDHMPPFLDNDIRSFFNSEYVPFIDIQISDNLKISAD